MSDYFYYKKPQRRIALKLWLQSLVVLVFCILFYFNNPFSANETKSFHLILSLSIFVFLVLCFLGAYFWYKNQEFLIRVDDQVFECFDPIFQDFCFTIPLSDINGIRHSYSKNSKKWSFKVHKKDGDVQQISPNASYSREELYQALEKVAPHIDISDTAANSKRP